MIPVTVLIYFLFHPVISDFLKITFIGFLLEEIKSHKADSF